MTASAFFTIVFVSILAIEYVVGIIFEMDKKYQRRRHERRQYLRDLRMNKIY